MTQTTKPIRILHVLGSLSMGGAESRIMDLYREIDRTKVQFDFLVHYAGDRPKQFYDDEVLSLGGQIYPVLRFNGKNLNAYKKAMKEFFAMHHDYAAIEGHMTSTAAIYLPIAKAAGIPVAIGHARSAGVDAGMRGIATRFFRLRLASKCDYMLSCSKAASISVFGERAYEAGRVDFAPNAIDTDQFAFDEEARNRIRAEFQIPEGALVIGHVGRFAPVKNQLFLAKAACYLHDANPDLEFRFLFIGDGEQKEECRQIFAEHGIENKAIFAGVCDRKRTVEMYQAMDLFVLPSLYEGLPGTAIEAQAAGLPGFISNPVTDEACVTGLMSKLPITDPIVWAAAFDKTAEEFRQTYTQDRRTQSESGRRALEEAGYNVHVQAKRMENWYLKLSADPTARHLI